VLSNSKRKTQEKQGFVFIKYKEIVEHGALMSPNPSALLEYLVVGCVCVLCSLIFLIHSK